MTDTDEFDLLQHLSDHGPTPLPEMPVNRIRPKHREQGVRTITLSWSNKGGPTVVPGPLTTVVYHKNHSPIAVVRTYIDANPDVLNTTKGSITRHFREKDPKLGKAWKAIAVDYDVRTADDNHDRTGIGGGDQYSGNRKTCKFCGAEDIASYAHHLPNCDKK